MLQCSLPKKLMVVNIKIVKFIYENYENIVGQITLILLPFTIYWML